MAYARAATANKTSPLYGMVDVDNIVIAGHSMGATCSIIAGTRSLTDKAVKLVITQHPGICGPFGPPPWPSTWLKSDLEKLTATFPVLFTTATNDGAFWPAPHTAEHERGCFEGGVSTNSSSPPTIFAQFNAQACNRDHSVEPFDASGHDCREYLEKTKD